MPLKAYLLLLIGLIVGPALVVGTLILVVDGTVPDLSDPRDIIGFVINGGLGLVLWLVAANAFRRSMREGDGAATPTMAVVAKVQPLLWLIGVGLGVFAGFGIIESAQQTRESLARFYCDDVFEADDLRFEKCLTIALDCSDEVDDGPCGSIDSPEAADRCVDAHRAAVEKLPETERADLPETSGDYDRAMLRICLLENSRSH